MKSPKFQFNQVQIRKIVTKETLKKRWKSLGKQLRRQVLFDIVEYKDFDSRIDSIIESLVSQIDSASYRPSKPDHYLVEKSRGLCRQMTLCRPEDLLVLEVLTNSLKESLINKRPSKNAFFEPDEQRFGKGELKFGIDNYSATKSWKNFQQAIFSFSKERAFVVVTDVANFYDFINFNHLRNIVSSICEVSEDVLDLLLFILNELSWTPDFMPRAEVGLPQMESNAPRVLANAMLFELDKVAEKNAFGDYARFMDDIDIGLDSIANAKRTIRDIDLTLQSRQLRLNASKTKILSQVDAFDHFCIRENRFLDFCSYRINKNSSSTFPALKKGVEKAYNIWRGRKLTESRFTRGNGDKLFKYLAKVGKYIDFDVPSDDLLTFIRLYPSMRQTGFMYLSHKNHPNSDFYGISRMFFNGIFVDDFSYIQMANFCTHARFRADAKLKREMRKLITNFQNHGTDHSLYSALFIGSKFLPSEELFLLVEETYEKWKSKYWLGRIAGGLTPVIGTSNSEASNFYKLIMKSRNQAAEDIYEFHRHVQTRKSTALRFFQYAKAQNHSFPQGIIHPKALIIHSMAFNPDFTTQLADIKKEQAAFHTDPFYRAWNL